MGSSRAWYLGEMAVRAFSFEMASLDRVVVLDDPALHIPGKVSHQLADDNDHPVRKLGHVVGNALWEVLGSSSQALHDLALLEA
jgi:hypothetical protein